MTHSIYKAASILGATLMGTLALPASGQSYITECAASLRPDTVALTRNRYAQSSVLQTLTTAQSVTKKADGSFDIPDYFSGSYSSSDDARSSLSSYMNSSWSTAEYLGYVASYVPKAAYAAYDDCLKRAFGRAGMHIEIETADENSVNVIFHFNGASGSRGRYTVLVTSDALPVTAVKRVWSGNNDTQRVRLIKVDPAQSVHITANIVGGPDVPDGDSATIPPYIRTDLIASRVAVTMPDPQSILCGGNNSYDPSTSGSYGPPIIPAASADYYDPNPQVGMEAANSWNGPGPVEPRYAWDTLSNKIIRLHTVCTVGSGMGDNRFFIRSKVDYVLNHFEPQVISPVPTNKPLRDISITDGGRRRVTLVSSRSVL